MNDYYSDDDDDEDEKEMVKKITNDPWMHVDLKNSPEDLLKQALD